MPFFSIIIATRNRPFLFARALKSVLVQSCPDIEIIVINDGSATEHQLEYDSFIDSVKSHRVHYFTLPSTPQGHGQSFVINFGASKACAPYLCFLDDDDLWIDPHHLARAQTVITALNGSLDLYMANQAAFLDDERQPGPNWLGDLPGILAKCGNRPDNLGTHTVTIEDVLRSRGFCHLNTLIVRRALYDEIGGMEGSIRWECDHDLYLRLIDRAVVMKYAPVTVAQHNIPDPRKAASMTTMLSEIERRLFQLTVFMRARRLTRHRNIHAYADVHYVYTLKRIAEAYARAGRHVEAAQYAYAALCARPSVKWAGYTAWSKIRALIQSVSLSRHPQHN